MAAQPPPSASPLVDLGVGSLLAREAHHRAVTRILGVPVTDQNLVTTVVLTGALVTAVAAAVPKPWSGLTGTDAMIGGSLLSAMGRGLLGEPSKAVPLAGTVVAGALVAQSVRPAIAASAKQIREVQREVRQAYRSWTSA